MRLRTKLLLVLLALCLNLPAVAQVKIVQLSDLHLGLARAPRAADNLRRAVELANQRHPDAVVVTGDIGENPRGWEEAREILRGVQAPVYYIPGNHDVHSNDVERYRRVFGPDFYRVQIKNVVLYGFDSELLGNFDNYDVKSVAAAQPAPEARDQGERMFHWMEEAGERGRDDRFQKAEKDRPRNENRGGGNHGRHDRDRDDDQRMVVIGMQHIPLDRDGNMPPDPRPYWAISEPNRSRELALLKKLGIHHMLAGHWHRGDVFDSGGITWHMAPATSWLPWGGHLGFAVHTITPDGDMKTEFVNLD